MAYNILPYSTFLDYTSYGTTTATNVADAYHLSDIHAAPASDTINVAFILPRANDPTAVLDSMSHVLGLDANDPYITSQASRTIWVSLTATQFHDVFNTTLLQGTTPE